MKNQFTRFLDKFQKDDQPSFGGIIENLSLIFRLMKDPRVDSRLKLLPVGALLYLIVPIDFLPINPLEDAVILWLGGTLFIELCPEDIVQEHRRALHRASSGVDITETIPHEIVDAEFKDLSSHEDQ
ncbi:MAG: YkvA family protein [Kosmotogaceae bacterium]